MCDMGPHLRQGRLQKWKTDTTQFRNGPKVQCQVCHKRLKSVLLGPTKSVSSLPDLATVLPKSNMCSRHEFTKLIFKQTEHFWIKYIKQIYSHIRKDSLLKNDLEPWYRFHFAAGTIHPKICQIQMSLGSYCTLDHLGSVGSLDLAKRCKFI